MVFFVNHIIQCFLSKVGQNQRIQPTLVWANAWDIKMILLVRCLYWGQNFGEMEAWGFVEIEDWMSVLTITWVFKLEWLPDGLINKFKAWSCYIGNKQLEGDDYFETWSHMVQWVTVNFMLVLQVLLYINPIQVNFTCASLHDHL